jgi:hypothetical protein
MNNFRFQTTPSEKILLAATAAGQTAAQLRAGKQKALKKHDIVQPLNAKKYNSYNLRWLFYFMRLMKF